MKPKEDKSDDNRIPGFDTWPPPSRPKEDKKRDDAPRNSSYREEKQHDEGDMAVFDVEEPETEIDREKPEDEADFDK